MFDISLLWIGFLGSLQLRMALSPIWVVLCSLGPTLFNFSAADRASMAIFSPARLQASTSTFCVTPSLTIQSSDRVDTWIGESSTLLPQSRSVMWFYFILFFCSYLVLSVCTFFPIKSSFYFIYLWLIHEFWIFFFCPYKAFGHESFDPRHGHTTENLHQTFLKTLQGEALPSLIETMMGHLQDVMLRSDTLCPSKEHWEVDGIFAFCYKVSNWN